MITRPDGPRGDPLLGSARAIFRDPLKFNCGMLQYGPLAHARVGPAHLYLIRDPALIEQFLIGEHARCVKDRNTRTLGLLLGQSLLTSDGEAWKQRRKFAAPMFQPRRVDSYAATMRAVAEAYARTLRHGERRDFHADSMRLTLEIAGRTLCGVSPGAEAERFGALLEVLVDYFEQRLFSFERLVPFGVPTRGLRRFRAAKAELDALLRTLVARAGDGDHLLARMNRAREESGMSEQQMFDELLTMLLAGHETSALALSFTIYLLSAHRVERERARSDDAYLDAVLRESMRLYPPAYALGREVIEDFELDGFPIPRGSNLVVSPYATHRNPAYFAEPERFRPERWLDGSLRDLPRCAYMPFGAGPRFCVGTHFAWLEATLVLKALLQAADFDVEPGFELALSAVVTLRPRAGIPVRVSALA
ncbi:MAG TPA: cytochrome P450 [Polyangiales bacterium]|nr:cytochrome P450 [Polyangiales bacterium]